MRFETTEKEHFAKYIGKRMVRARKEMGLSQKQVAEKMHISQGELSKLEKGLRLIDLIFLAEIAGSYNKPFTDFLPKGILETYKLWNDV